MRKLPVLIPLAFAVLLAASACGGGGQPHPGLTGKIAFLSDRGGGARAPGIYVMNADGSDLTRLFGVEAFDLAWSPDGFRLAYVGTDANIYVINADGSERTAVTGGDPLAENTSPAWSPDGTRIAFQSWTASAGDDVYAMNADGSDVTRLTHDPPGTERGDIARDRSPAWSPDGARIAFISNRQGTPGWGLYVMKADGSDAALVAESVSFDSAPAWSPDGQRIAYVSSLLEDIYLINPDGSNPARLTKKYDNWGPTWSPDGRHIAFCSNRDSEWDLLGPTEVNLEIYVMDADGSGQARLTHHDGFDCTPAWSPAP